MLRWILFSVVVVAAAGIATLASSFVSTSSSSSDSPAPVEKVVPSGPAGLATVDAPTTFEAGTMAQQTDGQHEWYIKNTGAGDLRLSQGESTCSCTIANLADGKEQTLAPGESTKITLNWNTKANNGKWAQTATIKLENDPEKRGIDFKVEGTVRPAIIMFPSDGTVDFGSVENETPHVRDAVMFSLDRPETKYKIKGISNPSLLDASVTPVSPAELKQVQAHENAELKSASKVSITLKTNVPIGSFAEEIRLETDHPSRPAVTLSVRGIVQGPITLTPGRLSLSGVSSKKGDSQKATIWVRRQKTTHFTVERKPKNVEVALVPVGDTAGAASRYQLTLTIPAGAAAGSIIDEVVLKTDHPGAAEIRIPIIATVKAD